jgi:hypothetical protein
MGAAWGRSRRGAAVVVAVVVVLAIAGLAFAAASTSDEDPRVHSGSGGPSKGARMLRLDGGRAGYVAVSSSDRVRVWWRGRGEAAWSAPEVVDGGSHRYLWGTTVRVAGTTVAIRADYNTQPLWEDDPEERGVATNVFIVCRQGSCVVSHHFEHLQESRCLRGSCLLSRPESMGVGQVPELSSDGGQVYFGATENGYVMWGLKDGLRQLKPEGLPGDGAVGAPMLAPDGSLRVVSGRAGAGVCRLTLLTSAPLVTSATTIRYTEQVTTSAPSSSANCATTLEAFTSEQLLIHTDRAEPAYLIRHGDSWEATDQDPTGMVRYRPRPGRQAAGSVVRTGYWHGREVVTASPDGRQLVAQVHFPGAAAWTEPTTVAWAPRGLRCFEIAPTSTPTKEPFYVSMRCRSRSSAGAAWSYVGVHAVTGDGRTWASTFGDQLPTRVGEDLYFGGAPPRRWTPDGGLTDVGLPVPDNSESFLVDDGSYVLVTAQPGESRCRLEIRVAEPGASHWSAPLTNPSPFVPTGQPCRPVGQYDGRVVTLYFPSDGGRWRPARVTRSGGDWIVTARRRAG